MANIIRLPVALNLPWYTFTITLEDAGYQFEMAYNTRPDRWSLTLSNAAGVVVVRNIPVLIDRDLLANCKTLAVPPGSIVAIDTTGKQNQPTLGSFLTTHAMFYAESGG